MLVGQQFGPFTIDKELGSGAMGTVYRGRYIKTGQVVAIKVMAPGLGATNAAAQDRFEREITLLKRLNHPNIVRLFGSGKQNGARYFAMEYIDGESLDRIMARRDRMSWEEVVALGQQLCAALQHAHEQGVVHRDLKPSNLMITADGTLKLTDFGIARASDLEQLTATNCTVGTASYMSPEQCKGERNLTHKSDLYSLGVLFYELLTGQKPFKADNAMDMFLQHVQGTFQRPSRIALDIPIWLDTLICQLLEKKPEQRPFDAAMVSNVLGGIREKVEAQQSAGVEAVRRRMMDRTPGQGRPDEEDKEAARTLLTGRGKPRRKAKKKLYKQVWLQAAGILFLLAGIAVTLYFVFRPPSAETLYRKAEVLMKSGDPDKENEALSGPIDKYLYHYRDRNDAMTQQVKAWGQQVEVRQCEDKLRAFLTRPHYNAQPGPEEIAFPAAKAEEEGDLDKAKKGWEELRKAGSERWSVVASNHLRDLDSLGGKAAQFQRLHEEIRRNGGGQALPDAREQKAFLAWRAEWLGDRSQERRLLLALKRETDKDPAQRFWFLYAAVHVRPLKDKPDKEKDSKELVEGKLQEVRKGIDMAGSLLDARLICLDILAVYGEDKELGELVQRAGELWDEINKKLGQRPADSRRGTKP